MRKLHAIIALLLAACFLLGGCGSPAPAKPTASAPDAAQLPGDWEQFIPVESMPQSLTLTEGGNAAVNDAAGKWKLDGTTLTVRQGGEERSFSYTLSGYMLTLYDKAGETSAFYINPKLFADGAYDNAKLSGQWAAYSTYAVMNYDGKGRMDYITYNTAGRVALQSAYTARDGILMTVDDGGNYTFNLYAFSAQGMLLLAESSEYDNDERQYSTYSKLTDANKSLQRNWKRVVCITAGAANQMPLALELKPDGSGTFTDDAGTPDSLQWQFYDAGFLMLIRSDVDVRYAYVDHNASVLYLGNEENHAWYVDEENYKPDAAGLKDYIGTWKAEDGGITLKFDADGTMHATNSDGKTTALAATAANGVLRMELGGKTYYMAAVAEEGVLNVHFAGMPFLADAEMPITLIKE